MKKRTFTTTSSDETRDLGMTLAPLLQGKLVYLQGELGAGKTTFVRGLAAGLGLKDRVASPTFTYERIYGKGSRRLFHFDLYRVSEKGDMLLEEELYELCLEANVTIVIEWPEKVKLTTTRSPITLTFTNTGDNTRTVTMSDA